MREKRRSHTAVCGLDFIRCQRTVGSRGKLRCVYVAQRARACGRAWQGGWLEGFLARQLSIAAQERQAHKDT